jgi:hypothetical protein
MLLVFSMLEVEFFWMPVLVLSMLEPSLSTHKLVVLMLQLVFSILELEFWSLVFEKKYLAFSMLALCSSNLVADSQQNLAWNELIF